MCYTHIEIFRYEVRALTTHHGNSKVFMAFCDVTRLRILELLRKGEKSATFLREKVDAGQSTISHHMKILVESGVVLARKQGKWTFYSISKSGVHYASALLRYLTSANKPYEPAELANPIEPIEEKKPIEKTKEQRRSETLRPFTIVVDTSCDLHPEFIEEHGIKMMPIPFVLDGVEHSEGYWQDITGKEFYDALRKGGTAKTSQINPDAFVNAYTEYAEQDKDALFIILSGCLSATHQSSLIALTDIKEKYPNCNIYPVDSIAATSVGGLLTMLAVEKRNEGYSAEETAAYLEHKKHSLFGVFTVDDLMYLHRGGRLSKLSAVGGSILGIKPILGIQPDGSLGLKEKARGRDAALKLLVSQMERSVAPGSTIDKLLIPHTDCEEDAQKLVKLVKETFDVRNTDIILMGPVIGAHVGPGTVALVYESDLTREEFETEYYS